MVIAMFVEIAITSQLIKTFPIWCNVNFVSVFTSLNNTKKNKENLTLHHMGKLFYQLTYWDKI